MYKIYLVFFLVIIFTTSLFSQQWNLISPFPDPYLFKVAVPDSNHLKGINEKYFLRSDDGGITWSKSILNYRARDILFHDSLTGWLACDSSRILHTVDGGHTWNQQNLPISASLDLYITNLQFVDTDTGFCIGGQKLFYTHDGGLNWLSRQGVFINTGNVILRFKDAQHGWVTSSGATDIFKTVDGGQNWSVFYLPFSLRISSQKNCMDFSDTLHGWIALQDDSILRTADGGNTWQLVPSGIAYSSLNFFDSLNGFMLAGSILYNTFDGGINWDTCFLVKNAAGEYQLKLNQGVYYFSGNGNFFKSFDAYNWTQIGIYNFKEFSPGHSQGFLKFHSPKTGVMVSGWIYNQQFNVHHNSVYITRDSCLSWLGGAMSSSISDFELVNDSIYYYTSYDETSKWLIYKTSDAWKTRSLITTSNSKAICFTDALHGVCYDKYTTDGGITWNPVTVTGGNGIFNDIYFIDFLNGFAIDNSNVFKSTDGGINWTKVYSPAFSVTFYKLQFTSLMHGVLLGQDSSNFRNLILKTYDGGLNWDTIRTPFPCLDFHFNDSLNGWLTFFLADTSQEGIYYTSDGGSTFTRQDNHRAFYLTFLGSNGYAVGSALFLKSDQSGVINFGDEIEDSKKVIVSPNPSSGEIAIRSDELFYFLELYSSQGKLIFNKKIVGNTFHLNMQDLSSGVYFLKLHFKNEFITKRIIIMN